MGVPTKQLELLSNDRYLHISGDIIPTIHRGFILGVFLMPPRLRMQYEATSASSLEICKDHVPAVTITFICPSRRYQVGDTHFECGEKLFFVRRTGLCFLHPCWISVECKVF